MVRPSTSILALALLMTSPLGCKIEDTPGDDEIGDTSTGESETTDATETESESTDTESTDEGDFIPGDTTETETGEPEPKSCREMLDCVFMCLGDLGLECLQTCGEGFDPAEGQKAGALVVCLAQACTEKMQCSLDDLTNPDCIGCIGLGLFLPEPPGCEEQALACE